MQVVWYLLKKEQKREVSIYKTPATSRFVNRSSIRTKRAKIWSKEQIEERNKYGNV